LGLGLSSENAENRASLGNGETKIPVRGEEALARAVLEVGATFATGYPGSPGPGVLEHIGRLSWATDVEARWAPSPRSAFEWARGASLAGRLAVVCLSGQAFASVYPSLVAAARTGVGRGVLVIVGDDPGAWDSFAELDSRVLAAAAEVPVFEPASIPEAATMVGEGYGISRSYDVPVVIRITTGFAEEEGTLAEGAALLPGGAPGGPVDSLEGDRLSLPLSATLNHERLHARLDHLRHASRFSRFVETLGEGKRGIVAVGHAFTKLTQVLGSVPVEPLRILRVGQVYPPPDYQLLEFALASEAVLVLEEGEPFVEQSLRTLLSEHIQKPKVYGKLFGPVAREGELQRWHVEEVLRGFEPKLDLERPFFPLAEKRDRPSTAPVCLGCSLADVFSAFRDVLNEVDLPVDPLVVGDHGCALHFAHRPWRAVDVLPAPGSALSLAMGMLAARPERRVVVVTGDYSFADTSMADLLEASARNLPLTIVLLDNGVSGYTGGQPRSAMEQVSIEDLVGTAKPTILRVVNEGDTERFRAALEEALLSDGLAVLVVKVHCLLADLEEE